MSAEPFVIRPMADRDLDQVVLIANGLAQAPHWTRQVYGAWLNPASAPRRIVLVAETPETGAVVGFAIAAVAAPPEAELESIGVAAQWQRQGLGRLLLEEMERDLKRLGVTRVFLEVRRSNLPAQELYRSRGFKVVGNRAGYYVDSKEDAIVMHVEVPEN